MKNKLVGSLSKGSVRASFNDQQPKSLQVILYPVNNSSEDIRFDSNGYGDTVVNFVIEVNAGNTQELDVAVQEIEDMIKSNDLSGYLDLTGFFQDNTFFSPGDQKFHQHTITAIYRLTNDES